MAVDKTRFIPESQINVESSGDIGSTNISADAAGKYLTLDKMGNTVNIRLSCALNSSIAGNNALIATIPEKYRPRAERAVAIFGTLNNVGFNAWQGKITTDGKLKTATGSLPFSGVLKIVDIYFI